MGSLHEIETRWSLEDVIMANLQLTYTQRQKEDARERAEARAKAEQGKVR